MTSALRPALFAILLMILASAAGASPSNKWRLQFSGGAESDGGIELKLTPVDGEDVLLKKRRRAANFDVEVVLNTVKNVRINPDRE